MKKQIDNKDVTLTIDDLCTKVSETSGVSTQDVKRVVESFLDTILRKLKLK